VKRLYALLLYLFPKAYREEYGEEMQAVFDLSLGDARESGGLEVARVTLRELSSLPKAILYEHLRERRKAKMAGKFVSRFDFAPGSNNEALAALTPFLLFGALPILFSVLGKYVTVPMWLNSAFGFFLLISMAILFLMAIVKSMPRWALPYMGLPLPVISILLFNALPEFPVLFNRLYDISWFSGAFVFGGLVLMGVLLSAVLLVLLTGIIPQFRSFHFRLREDWTLLCFILYGAIPFIIVVAYEGFKKEELFKVLAFLVLAIGAWVYLRSEQPREKFLSLLGGMTLAMVVTAVGQEVLYESSFPATGFPSWTTSMSTVIWWIWMTLFMLLSLALNLLPREGDRSRTV
jgi:hypothetical protein